MIEKNPMQPIIMTDNGIVRFKENKIVRYLLDNGSIDMNQLAIQGFSDDDSAQFAQLIGYSVSGGGGLSYFTTEQTEKADKIADKLINGGKLSQLFNRFKFMFKGSI